MTVPAVSTGRGAWSVTGKDNGSRYYAYVEGKPLDGGRATYDENYQAVNFGVKAIQARVNAYGGYSPSLIVDGLYGKGTAAGVKWMQQAKLGVSADGVVGPTTARAMFKDLLIWFAGAHHVPASQLHGFVMLESGYDPGALGIISPADRGLNQINEDAHPNITDEMAFDPIYSIDYTAKRLGDARIKYSGKSADLKNRCAIAQHNSPVAANYLYETGEYQNDKSRKYVEAVLNHALNFKA